MKIQLNAAQLVLIAAVSATAACGTVTTKTNESTRASYDRQDTTVATSGVLDFWRNDKGEIIGRKVSDHFKERNDALIDLYGDQFTPALKKGEGFTAVTFQGKPAWGIDRERHEKMGQMIQWKRNGRIPTSGLKKFINKLL